MKKLVTALLFCILCTSLSAQGGLPDGLYQDCIDATLRINRRGPRGGTGTGSIVEKKDGKYTILTNHHVAGSRGTRNTIEGWNNGTELSPVDSKVVESFFHPSKSKDIAKLQVSVSEFDGPMPVVPLAPYGNDKNLKAGVKLWQVGCDSGRWVNAERGTILRYENGLIYYRPDSIPGNSGGPIYSANGKNQIGVTAWYTTIRHEGKTLRVGLAMSSDRVRDILAKRVSMYPDDLPRGAVPISEALPLNAEQIPLAVPTGGEPLYESTWRLPGSRGDQRSPQFEDDAPKVEPPKKGEDVIDLIPDLLGAMKDELDESLDDLEVGQALILDKIDGIKPQPALGVPTNLKWGAGGFAALLGLGSLLNILGFFKPKKTVVNNIEKDCCKKNGGGDDRVTEDRNTGRYL